MPVEHVTGDLFSQWDLDALAQGVNTEGVMGAGIAVRFRRRDEDMYEAYRAACLDGSLKVGGFFPWSHVDADGRLTWDYNLASQERRGADARLDAIESSLTLAIAHAEANGVCGIGLPQIGCGIGGLAWDDVREVIERLGATTDVLLRTVTWAP